MKLSRKKSSSVSNYISSPCCYCFTIFGNSFCSVVCWSVVFKMQKWCFAGALEIGVFKNFVKFTGKHLHWSLFLIKLQALSACNCVKKRLQNSEFCEVLSAAFLQNNSRRLLLEMPCRIYCNLCRLSHCNNIKVERTAGDTWILLILLAAIFDLIWWKFIC